MTTQSMTGFGRGENPGEKFTLNVELKSVNHRFKDYRFKMSSIFNKQEIALRKMIEANFARGSIDIHISYKKNTTQELNHELDYNKIKTYLEQLKANISDNDFNLQISPTEFLRNDFYVEDDDKEDELNELLVPAFEKAVEKLKESRQEEGAKLVDTLLAHKTEYTKYYEQVKTLRNSYQDKVKEKLNKRFETDAKELSIDEPRFIQEVIYYLEKLDIDEEINRIQIHLEKLDKILAQKNKEVGRQIDFLIQELNRETNTIGSKSGSSEISENIVQMKVQLEKIREQALNLQ